jgi:hypothetical protein
MMENIQSRRAAFSPETVRDGNAQMAGHFVADGGDFSENQADPALLANLQGSVHFLSVLAEEVLNASRRRCASSC